LTYTEASVLSLGLKFIPKPSGIKQTDIDHSYREFSRRIMLTDFFHKKELSDTNENRFNIKSTWLPPTHMVNKNVLGILDKLREELKNVNLKNRKCLQSNQFTRVLKAISGYSDIIVKPADKGSSIVVQNLSDYTQEIERQLSVPLHYRKLDQPVYPSIRNNTNKLLNTLYRSKVITKKEFHFLEIPESPRPRLFYTLPKIHKPVSKWYNSIIPPGRPVVSDCSSDTYNLSILIDHFLQPISNKHPSYVKDTPDFISKLRKVNIKNPKCYLITLDVESLYTNIDNKDGVEAVKQILQQYLDPKRPDTEFLKFLETCLANNDFQFNKQWFLQLWGTSMGKRFSPAYADIFMAHFEQKTLKNCSKLPELYLRYLDDIFMIWIHSLEDFQNFLDVLNNSHPTIKFKATISEVSVDFLDVTVYKGPSFKKNGTLDTKVYFKSTDTHELLHKLSYHPKHTFSGLIKSQVLRFRRICTNDYDFEQAWKILYNALKNRSYTARLLRNIKNRTLAQYYGGDCTIGLSYPCNKTTCSICPKYFKNASHITAKDGTRFNIKQALSCSSENAIYCIQCNKCNSQYVGQTSLAVRTRISQHRSNLRCYRETNLTNHFFHCFWNNTNNSYDEFDFSVFALQQVDKNEDKTNNTIELLKAESQWISKLKSVVPNGMNKKKEAPGLLPVILKYSDNSMYISNVFKKHYTQLQQSFPQVFRQKLITAHSRNKNIQDMLVRAQMK